MNFVECVKGLKLPVGTDPVCLNNLPWRWFLVILLILLARVSDAQEITQTISGHIQDAVTGSGLANASISAYHNDNLVAGTSSDSQGNFVLTVSPGRYRLVISFTGYKSDEQELLVIAGKPSQVDVALVESSVVLSEVVVATPALTEPGLTTLSIEKTLRVPANFFDPVRMLVSYPGVVTANDQANSIVVKGYSPNALLWRLQGLDIVNPNHLANAGTLSDKPVANGGGVNILSAQLLDKTNFYSGYLPTGYGNALAGVMDMSLRAGATNKVQYTAQASLIGLDVAAEGPLQKNSRSSFLVNYRYSTVGLLSKMGLDFGDEAINFQDLSFNLNFPMKKGGNLSAFGFAGGSTNRFDAKPQAEWEEEKDRYTIDYDGQVFGLGIVNQFKPGWASVSIGASVSGQSQQRQSQGTDVPYVAIYSEYYESARLLASTFLKAVRKVNDHASVEAGITVNYVDHELDVSTETPLYIDAFYPNVAGTVNGLLAQPYVNWMQRIGSFHLNAGLRYVNFSYNNSANWEPRISVGKSFQNHLITLAYTATSQWQQTQTYLALANDNLPFSKSNQVALEWKHQIKTGFSLASSFYYHQLYNVPVLPGYEQYSLINQWEDFPDGRLEPTGKGRNYGVEVAVEKRFYSDVYFMATGSYFESLYQVNAGYQDSRFNGKFTSTLLGGKEWKNQSRAFGIHARVLYTGGLRQAPVDVFASSLTGTTIYNVLQGYTVQLPNYFRTDLRVSWRKNKPRYTRTISIDIQNLTNYQNLAGYYYDTFLQEVTPRYQLGIIPVLAYRVDF